MITALTPPRAMAARTSARRGTWVWGSTSRKCGVRPAAIAVAKDEQVAARELIVKVGGGDDLTVVRQPIQFDGWGGVLTRSSPRLGEHSGEILSDLGYDAETSEDLVRAGVIAQAPAV